MLDPHFHEELRALRDLERTVRAYSVSAQLVSREQRFNMLASALRAVIAARKSSIKKSKLPSYE
jgi:hypothetical protein